MNIKFWIKNTIPLVLSLLILFCYNNAVKIFRIMRTMIATNISPNKPDPFSTNQELLILRNNTSLIFTIIACLVAVLLVMSIIDTFKKIVGKERK